MLCVSFSFIYCLFVEYVESLEKGQSLWCWWAATNLRVGSPEDETMKTNEAKQNLFPQACSDWLRCQMTSNLHFWDLRRCQCRAVGRIVQPAARWGKTTWIVELSNPLFAQLVPNARSTLETCPNGKRHNLNLKCFTTQLVTKCVVILVINDSLYLATDLDYCNHSI